MTYRAITDIRISGGVYAHRVGDVVPDENVKANGWEDKVALDKPAKAAPKE